MTTRVGYERPRAVEALPRPTPRRFPLARAAWAAGAVLFLGLAAAVAVVPLSWPDDRVPPEVTAGQQARTELAAGQVGRALSAGASDLTAVAAGIRVLDGPATPGKLLSRLVSDRGRYRGAAYLAPGGRVRARAGDIEPTTSTARVTVDAPHVYVSVPVTGPRRGRVVAELTLSASLTGPGNTRLVDARGRVVGATRGAAVAGPGQSDVVTRAPVAGPGGLVVVTVRKWTSPVAAEKRELLLLGVLIATLTIVIFGWLHTLIIGPLGALARAADRLCAGDIADPVIVRRYDRLGLVARDLERMRHHLLRRN